MPAFSGDFPLQFNPEVTRILEYFLNFDRSSDWTIQLSKTVPMKASSSKTLLKQVPCFVFDFYSKYNAEHKYFVHLAQ